MTTWALIEPETDQPRDDDAYALDRKAVSGHSLRGGCMTTATS